MDVNEPELTSESSLVTYVHQWVSHSIQLSKRIKRHTKALDKTWENSHRQAGTTEAASGSPRGKENTCSMKTAGAGAGAGVTPPARAPQTPVQPVWAKVWNPTLRPHYTASFVLCPFLILYLTPLVHLLHVGDIMK